MGVDTSQAEPNQHSPWQTTAVTVGRRSSVAMRGGCLAPALLAFLVHAKEDEEGGWL